MIGEETGAPEIVVVMITAGSDAEAEALGEALLGERLVACVNRITGIRSRYWWQGAVEGADECLLIAKTRRSLFPRLLEVVRSCHSYEVFEAVALPVVECNPDYARWVVESTREA
jgi:periplasmic divalent cation tolerance protein